MKAMVYTLFFCLILASCGDDETARSAPEPDVPSRSLTIIDSIGVEMGDSMYMFGSIEGLMYASDGTIVLLDRAFSRIMIYDSEGEFLYQIGRSGDGPGEMNLTVGMVLTGNGDILVSQRDAIEHFKFQTSEWIGEYPRGETPPPFVIQGMPDSTFIGVHLDIIPDENRMMAEVVLGVYSPGNNVPLLILESNSFELNPFNAAFLFENVLDAFSVAVSDDGIIYVASNSGSDYLVKGYNFLGEPEFELRRSDVQPVEMTEEELREEKEFMEARLASMGAEGQSCSPDPLLPMISGLGLDSEGNLWVRRGNARTPLFDIYNATGDLICTASLPLDPEEERYWHITVQPEGILAYSDNPSDGFQKVYILQ